MCDNGVESDQAARGILINHHGSQLRYWGSNILALAVAFFAVVQARGVKATSHYMMTEIFRLVLSVVLSLTLQAILRMYWYSRFLGEMISLKLTRTEGTRIEAQREDKSYIYQLHSDAVSNIRSSPLGWIVWASLRPAISFMTTLLVAVVLWVKWPIILQSSESFLSMFRDGFCCSLTVILPLIAVWVGCFWYFALKRWAPHGQTRA